jgi:hypothetical protein
VIERHVIKETLQNALMDAVELMAVLAYFKLWKVVHSFGWGCVIQVFVLLMFDHDILYMIAYLFFRNYPHQNVTSMRATHHLKLPILKL